MKNVLLPTFLLATTLAAFAQDAVDSSRLQTFVEAARSGRPERIAELVRYPLVRDYPLAALRTPAEFVAAFPEVLDRDLLRRLATSKPADWTPMGWRGIMFANGLVWLTEDYRLGSLNYQTAAGKTKWNQLVEQQRQGLPPALRTFDRPVLTFRSAQHEFRLDEVGGRYRLVQWADMKAGSFTFVLENGERFADGTLGSYFIDWPYGNKTYRFSFLTGGESDVTAFQVFDTKALAADPFGKPESEETALPSASF